jgi:hypothetical protein
MRQYWIGNQKSLNSQSPIKFFPALPSCRFSKKASNNPKKLSLIIGEIPINQTSPKRRERFDQISWPEMLVENKYYSDPLPS